MSREEILAAPLELWLAPVGEAFPDLGVAPVGNWELIGVSGDENYTDDGVTVTLSQTLETFTPVGTTMPVKAWRTEEGVMIGVTVADARAETLKRALNDNAVTEDGVAFTSEISLLRGIDVSEYALLARGKSPYDNTGEGQFQVPRCNQSAEPELVNKKGEPVGVGLEFTSLKPATASEGDFKAIYDNPAAT